MFFKLQMWSIHFENLARKSIFTPSHKTHVSTYTNMHSLAKRKKKQQNYYNHLA